MNTAHTPTCGSRGGRPVTTGTADTPNRSAGRHGQIWEDCVTQARADGQTMTAFVAAALRRELDYRRDQAVCASMHGGYRCQLKRGHDGSHSGGAGRDVVVWSDRAPEPQFIGGVEFHPDAFPGHGGT